MAFDDPAYLKLKEEVLGKLATSNGATPHQQPPQSVERPRSRDWVLEAGEAVKGVFDRLSSQDRYVIASMEYNTLVEQTVEDAMSVLMAKPGFPENMDADIRKFAEQAVVVFKEIYGPKAQVPATIGGEIDRTPIDAYEAAVQIRADVREYSWEGLVRDSCTMVLTALMGAGKTTLAMNLARGWALGSDVLGKKCQQSKTLVVVSPKEFEAWTDTIYFWGIKGAIYLIPSYKTHFAEGATQQALWFEETMKQLGCRTFILDTMFDYFGIPPHNSGDSNRIAMAEQTPLLETVRINNWSGVVTGHSPKSEAQALVSRDPEEAFAGHTAWTAQHRMRAVIRRKSRGFNAFITGRGGHGDQGILQEQMLLYDENTRLVSLGGPFSDWLGRVACGEVVEAFSDGSGWMSRSDICTATGKSKNFVHAGIKHAVKEGQLKWNQKKSRASKYALPREAGEDDPPQQGDLDIHGIEYGK
jgi:hypothetical protein